MRIALVAFVTALPLLLAAPAAQGGSITIEFDLTSSIVTMLDGVLAIPPDGTITSATALVTVQGSSLSAASAGVAQLSDLVLMATIDGTVGGAVQLTGGFTGSRVGGGVGSLTGGLAILNFGALSLNLNGIVNCFGGLCPGLGTFPASATNSLTVLTGGSLGIGGLGTSGAGTLTGVLSVNLGGNDVVLNLVGQEVSRIFVPEPSTAMLLGLGILSVLCLGATRIRRR